MSFKQLRIILSSLFIFGFLSSTSFSEEKRALNNFNKKTLENLFTYNTKIKEAIWDFIVLHHSATAGGTAKGFDYYHRNTFKDPEGLEYHFVIDNGIGKGSKDGLIEVGERWKKQIAANHLFRPELAPKSIAICLVGNFEESDSLTKKQFDAMLSLVQKLKERFKIPMSKIVLHNSFDGPEKTDGKPVSVCPGKFFPYKKLTNMLEKKR